MAPLFRKKEANGFHEKEPNCGFTPHEKIIHNAMDTIIKNHKFHHAQLQFTEQTGTGITPFRHLPGAEYQQYTAVLDLKSVFDMKSRKDLTEPGHQQQPFQIHIMSIGTLKRGSIITKSDKTLPKVNYKEGMPQRSPLRSTLFNIIMISVLEQVYS